MFQKLWESNCVIKAGKGQHIALYEQIDKSLRKLRSPILKVDKRYGSASHLPSLVCFGPLKGILYCIVTKFGRNCRPRLISIVAVALAFKDYMCGKTVLLGGTP